MICDNCKNEQANVHIIQVGQGYKKEVNLCLICFHKKGLNNSVVYLSDILGNVIKEFIAKDNTGRKKFSVFVCKGCSMSYDRFFETGLLGCPMCYESFGMELKRVLHRFHGSTIHVSNSSKKRSNPKSLATFDISKLKTDMKSAVKSENFEKAAELRDRIKLLVNDKKEDRN